MVTFARFVHCSRHVLRVMFFLSKTLSQTIPSGYPVDGPGRGRTRPWLGGRARGDPGLARAVGRGPDKQNRDEGHAQQSGLRTRTEAEAPRGAPRGSAWGRGSAPDSAEAGAGPLRPDTRWEAGSGCRRVARGHWGRSPLVGDPRAAACSFLSRPLSANVTYFPIVAVSLTQNYTTRLNARV